ncbi:MAG: TIGR04282 family arsenosugar biosynthesis glycosyltransferase [Gaiellaceae bacterium]
MSVSSGPPGRGARVLVVAKAPEPGRVKTRLVPLLGEHGAATLCRAMLLDTLETCRLEVADVGVLYARAGERAALAALAGPGAPLVLQEGEGHACALRTGMRATLAERDSALLVASDVPGVPPGSPRRALTALEAGADVVLGPSEDGGYWLVGMREPHVAPFERIPWSTGTVLEVTLDRCRAAGLEVALVDSWRDVDTPEDLAAIAGAAIPGRRTRALVAQHSHASGAPAPSAPRAAISEARS